MDPVNRQLARVVDVVMVRVITRNASALLATMIFDETQQLLDLPSLNTRCTLEKCTEGSLGGSSSLDTGDMLSVLEDVVISHVSGFVDDLLKIGSDQSAIAGPFTVDSLGRDLGTEGEDGANDRGREMHDDIERVKRRSIGRKVVY